MVECKECGTKLGILEGYRHPTMGKGHLLCSKCFDQVSESVEKWKEFVLSNSFNKSACKSNSQRDWKNMLTGFNQIQNMFNNVWQKKKSI